MRRTVAGFGVNTRLEGGPNIAPVGAALTWGGDPTATGSRLICLAGGRVRLPARGFLVRGKAWCTSLKRC